MSFRKVKSQLFPSIRVAVGAIALTAVLAGCSAAQAPNVSNSANPSAKPVGSFAGIMPPKADPLDAYMETASTSIVLLHATDLLVTRCMQKFGFEYQPSVSYTSVDQSDRVGQSRLYGITDKNTASKYGFLPAPQSGQADPNAEAKSSDAYMLVFYGVHPGEAPAISKDKAKSPGAVGGVTIPAGGCLGDARIQLTGSINGQPSIGSLGDDLHVKAFKEAWSDSRTEKAKAEWAGCMAKSGYKRHDPLNDKVTVTNEKDGVITRAPQSEVQQAIADIDCKVKTNFVARANAVNVEYSEKEIEKNQIALQQYKDFYKNLLNKANVVIANG